MLKRFIVENFLSYRDESILDLTAGINTEQQSHFVDFRKTKVLKSNLRV